MFDAVNSMTELTKIRFEEALPFTYCAVDMFGTFILRFKQSDKIIMVSCLHALIAGHCT